MDEITAAFTGCKVTKLAVNSQNPDGSGPLVVSVEFEGGGSLALITERPLRAFIPRHDGLPGRPMTLTPIVAGNR